MKIRVYYKSVNKSGLVVGYGKTITRINAGWPLTEQEILKIEAHLENIAENKGNLVFIEYMIGLQE